MFDKNSNLSLYNSKYLKYKNKYLTLKKIFGGTKDEQVVHPYHVNLNELRKISKNNDNNIKKNIDILQKLIAILPKPELSELLDEANIYKTTTEKHVKILTEEIMFISKMSNDNTNLARHIHTQSENIKSQVISILNDMEKQGKLHDIMNNLLKKSEDNIHMSLDTLNMANNKLNELNKEDAEAHEAYVRAKMSDHR